MRPSLVPPIVDVLHLPAPVTEAEHALRARLAPSDRPADLSSAPGRHDVLGVHARLRPKTPTDIRRDHVDPVGLEAEGGGEGVADPVSGLRRGIEHEPAVRLDGARLRLASSGQGATRWLMMRWDTTTSHPSKSVSSWPNCREKVLFVPTSG